MLQPPRGIVLAAVLLWVLGSLGGIGMTVLSPQVRQVSRMLIMERGRVHSLVGAMDYDAPVINDIIFWIEAGLSFFHTHAEGLGLVVLAGGTVVSTWIGSRRIRAALHTLVALGAMFPLGYLLYSGLIPLLGRDPGIELAEVLALIPFGSATILAMALLAVLLVVGRARGAPAPPPPQGDVDAATRTAAAGGPAMKASRPWRAPPPPLVLAAVLLLALAEAGGGLMGRYKADIREFVQDQARARPAAHGLVGLEDVDAEDLQRVATLLDGALRLFHMHGEGMALMLLGAGTVVQSTVAAGRLRTLLHLLIGLGGVVYPVGYLVQTGLTLAMGVERGRSAARTFVLWPAGGVLIAGLVLLAAVLISHAVRAMRPPRRAAARAAALLVALAVTLPEAGWAHHTGTFIPGDTDLTANFKQIKAAAQAQRFDVALRLLDEGAFLDQVVDLQGRLLPGLKEGLRDALRAKNYSRAELHWTAVMVYLARERVQEARRRVLDSALDEETKMRQGQKILNGAWRYYNLVDLPIYGVDPKAASSLKVAFEDGQYYLGSSLPDPMWTSGEVLLRKETYNPAKAAQILVEMDNTLTRVYDQLAYVLSPQRASGGAREGRWRGLITEITDDRITVRGEDGRLLTFRPSPRMGISPKHLREHMDRQVKVTVRYREEAGALRAVRITD